MENLQKRKGRLSPNEKETIIEQSQRGMTNKSIALQLGRDEDTVGRYIRQHRSESQLERIQQNALTDALRRHWIMLSNMAKSLSEIFSRVLLGPAYDFSDWPLPTSQSLTSVQRHLVESLREHIPNDVIWMLLRHWDQASSRFRQLYQDIGEQCKELVESNHPRGAFLIHPASIVDAHLKSCLSFQSDKESGVYFKKEFEGEIILYYGDPREMSPSLGVARVPDKLSLAVSKNFAEKIVQSVDGQLIECKKLLGELKELAARLDEAAGRIGLFTGFDGECSLCPIQTRKRRHKSRKGN